MNKSAVKEVIADRFTKIYQDEILGNTRDRIIVRKVR